MAQHRASCNDETIKYLIHKNTNEKLQEIPTPWCHNKKKKERTKIRRKEEKKTKAQSERDTDGAEYRREERSRGAPSVEQPYFSASRRRRSLQWFSTDASHSAIRSRETSSYQTAGFTCWVNLCCAKLLVHVCFSWICLRLAVRESAQRGIIQKTCEDWGILCRHTEDQIWVNIFLPSARGPRVDRVLRGACAKSRDLFAFCSPNSTGSAFVREIYTREALCVRGRLFFSFGREISNGFRNPGFM